MKQERKMPQNEERLHALREFNEGVAEEKPHDRWATGFSQQQLIARLNTLYEKYLKGKNICEIGCGDGRNLCSVVQSDSGSGKPLVVGLDISMKRLERSKEKLDALKARYLLIHSYGEHLPLKSNSCEGVICTEVLEHIPEDDTFLAETARILKPGAVAVFSVPTVSLGRHVDMFVHKKVIFFDPEEHVREYTFYKNKKFPGAFMLVKDLLKQFRSHGLEPLLVEGAGFQLPLGIEKYSFGRKLMAWSKDPEVNRFLSTLPVLGKLCVYTCFVLQKK